MQNTKGPLIASGKADLKVRCALFALALASVGSLFLLIVLMPRLKTLHASLGGKIPVSSSLLIRFSEFLGTGYGLGTVFVLIGVGSILIWRQKHSRLR